MGTYSDDVRESLREWAKTAEPGDEPHDFISEEADRHLIYHGTVREIVDDNNLWFEEPEIEPASKTPMGYLEVVAYEWLEGEMWDEWRSVEAERDDTLFWCAEHGEWRDDNEGETTTCEDCESVECSEHTTIAYRADFNDTPLCDDCYEERLNAQAEETAEQE